MSEAPPTADASVDIVGPPVPRSEEILTNEALAFVAELHRQFRYPARRAASSRKARREEIARTGRLDFLPDTSEIRAGEWTVAPAPADLQDRRVEITGPTEPKMAINALNSGAKVWLADLEDANTPHWSNVVTGQLILRDAVRRQLRYVSPDGKNYELRPESDLAVMVVRPRGWHFDEQHVMVDGVPAVGALVDFGLHFFHNAAELLQRGCGPYLLPAENGESPRSPALERRVHLRRRSGSASRTAPSAPRCSSRRSQPPSRWTRSSTSCVTTPRGLNAGRWDYLFSVIKYFRDAGPAFVLPDRAAVTMTAPIDARLHRTARVDVSSAWRVRDGRHGRVHPQPTGPRRSTSARWPRFAEDKEREAADGFDGSWVAHPDLVPVCREVFDRVLGDRPNQLDRRRDDVQVTAAALLDVMRCRARSTEAGLRNNVDVGLRYLEAWLGGNGAVAIHNLMEDAATAEISRSQIWQWVHNDVRLDTGVTVTADLVRRIADEELAAIRNELGEQAYADSNFEQARELFERVALADDFADFLTLPAYEAIAARD